MKVFINITFQLNWEAAHLQINVCAKFFFVFFCFSLLWCEEVAVEVCRSILDTLYKRTVWKSEKCRVL